MPGLATGCKAFSTPGIAALLSRRPAIAKRLERVVMVSATRIQSAAKARSPVDSGRMKTSINIQRLDDLGLEVSIGTNVVSAPPGTDQMLRGRKRPFRPRVPKGGYRSHGGYSYPRRQEYDARLRHTTGEHAFLRKSIADEAAKFSSQCRKALVNGLKGGA